MQIVEVCSDLGTIFAAATSEALFLWGFTAVSSAQADPEAAPGPTPNRIRSEPGPNPKRARTRSELEPNLKPILTVPASSVPKVP